MQSLEAKVCLDNPCRLDTCPQHILLRRHIIWQRDFVECVQVISSRVVQLILPGSGEAELDSSVLPQLLH